MGIESTVQHPSPHYTFTQSNTDAQNVVIDAGLAAAAPPSPFTHWRRLRVTFEWAGFTPLFVAVDHALTAAINLSKHDGSGTYKHMVIAAGSNDAIAGRTVGALELFAHLQEGEPVAGGKWHGHLSGFYTGDNSSNPDSMGGDYWGILGRFAFGGPKFALGMYAGETGRYSAHVTYDWPST